MFSRFLGYINNFKDLSLKTGVTLCAFMDCILNCDLMFQIELERLNTATDEINKLEVDLDEARNQFRQLLYESTIRIENCAKKLGNCIEKARPYYDARLKAKEALQETQKAAVNFERANSAHAAAKEMVYLAEEGLKTEGRTFDHAWQVCKNMNLDCFENYCNVHYLL